MKKAILIFLAAATSFAGCKESGTPGSSVETPKVSQDEILMQQALNRRDFATALVSINRILLADSTRMPLYDTLFAIYNETQNPYAVADVGPKILQIRPDDATILEPTAAAFELIGEYALALELEEKLFTVTGDPRLKLQIASNYFNQGNAEGAKAALQWVLDNRAQTDTIKLEQPMPSNPNKTQQIRLRAVAYYMMGNLYLESKDKKKAKEQFELAMKIEPYYDMAAASLLELMK